uniref:RNA-directed DNA polymerase, eukaryota n=1 Tax=Tanacetum cinerariifolium TaxID=118510 RepID=A0A6L2JZ60_TANCI|nr:RNA-directed DNA polymerase, eukaryota [Tanacetum cinerariifolium]
MVKSVKVEGDYVNLKVIKILTSLNALWEYISGLINRWKWETIVLGDFNEVRFEEERFGSIFNQSCARAFNHFISASGLLEVKMEGYSFTWSHPSATKMSKLDRFFVSKGIFSTFPAITAVCLDRHLSDHRPIILNEIHTDFGPTPSRIYHSWFKRDGFDDMVEQAWRSFTHTDSNRLIRFKKKLQDMKKIIRVWIRDKNISHVGVKNAIIDDLVDIDKNLDNGVASDEMLANRMELTRKLHDLKQWDLKDVVQKVKVKWAIEGDENSKFFHDIINKRRSQLAIRGVFVSGDWHTELKRVKDTFYDHFASRFKQPVCSRLKLKNKSPGPDGYTFEFFMRYWNLLGSDFCSAVECFFVKGSSPRGCNSSFIALIPKVTDAKFVTDFRPISLISSISNMASILVNGSPTAEFPFFCGLKQGDPLAPLLFILVMESLHISISRAVNDGVFKGLQIQGSALLSHLFYADDAVFIGECQVLGVGVPLDIVNQGASCIGCAVMQTPFKYLGVMVGDHMSRYSAWSNTIQKVRARLSK